MKNSLKALLLSTVLFGTTFAAFASGDGCSPGWAPFWATTCTYTVLQDDGTVILYEKTCSHFIFTTKCSTDGGTQL